MLFVFRIKLLVIESNVSEHLSVAITHGEGLVRSAPTLRVRVWQSRSQHQTDRDGKRALDEETRGKRKGRKKKYKKGEGGITLFSVGGVKTFNEKA